MRTITVSKSLAAANSTGIAVSQSLVAAGYLTLNGAFVTNGVAVLDTQRRVIITSAGNDSGITWTVNGTNDYNQPITDTFPGANAAAAQSNLDFKTVTSIYGSGATASTVTAGTNGVGSSLWQVPSSFITPFQIDFVATPQGSATFNLEYTLSDVTTPPTVTATTGPYADPPIVIALVSGATAQTQSTVNTPFRAWRVTITAGSGPVIVQATQAGIIQ